MKKIIAIVGMGGSGKSVASDILVNKGWEKVYFGSVTIDKLKEAGLEDNPKNEQMMLAKIRKDLGMGAYAKILLPKIKEVAQNNNTVLDGLYSWDEFIILKEEFKDNLVVIAIVADRKNRYSRLKERTIRPYTVDEAAERDIFEIENTAKAGPIAYADYYICNNGSLEDYAKRLDEILEQI